MGAVLVPVLTAGSVVAAAIATPLVSGIVQARSGDRLRASGAANLELVDKLRSRDQEWQQEIDSVHDLLRRQVAQIRDRDQAELDRRREWSALFVVAFLYLLGIPLLVLFYRLDQWWAWTLNWALLIFLIAMTIAGIDRAVHPPAPTDEEDQSSGTPAPG
ncbi:hypothetical protein E5083_03780 [Streptomyces bauhiniae]|uniref:Uncharacterized protein n=1 Tax=Streptomyces bauhiniae TaxID=2340725 RepID=A0A4Z1DGG2_9ACTN|nr:hypothetical protein [Streptomyces bauhiniae]TGN81637.1 hypothetical protein E5083_03780 [Streptomyces bauhiniae]